MNLAEARILVTGGTGLVGSNMVSALVDMALDVRATFHHGLPGANNDKYLNADLVNFEDCMRVTCNTDIVISAASLSFGSKLMREKPTMALLPNTAISLGLLEACARNSVRKLILISSATLYQPSMAPLAETDLDLNEDPAGIHFGVGHMHRYLEKAAEFYSRVYDLDICILRATSIFGPHDKFDFEKSNVLPALIRRAVEKHDPFTVWGDGSSSRDFIYVKDIVGDILDLCRADFSFEVFNCGHGSTMTIKQAVAEILHCLNHDIEPAYDLSKPTSVDHKAVSIEKLEGFLGHRKRTSFSEAVKATAAWYKNNWL